LVRVEKNSTEIGGEKMNRDFSKLRGKIREVYGTGGETKYAELLGLSTSSISGKLNGKIPFSLPEMDITIKEFGIQPNEIHEYFFKKKVEKNSTMQF